MKKKQLNKLEYFKKYSVWFDFDFVSLKPKTKPNQTIKINQTH
jgi:hypothetical protein